MNNLTSNILQVGQILRIPSQVPESEIPEGYAVYTVKANDNLYSIAEQYNVTVNDIVNFNQLDSTFLTIGQQLLIPATSDTPTQIDTIIYTVKPGDTIFMGNNE